MLVGVARLANVVVLVVAVLIATALAGAFMVGLTALAASLPGAWGMATLFLGAVGAAFSGYRYARPAIERQSGQIVGWATVTLVAAGCCFLFYSVGEPPGSAVGFPLPLAIFVRTESGGLRDFVSPAIFGFMAVDAAVGGGIGWAAAAATWAIHQRLHRARHDAIGGRP